MAYLLLIFGCWFVLPLIVWAIIVFLQSFWTKGLLWKIYKIWGCAIILLLVAFFISPTRFGTRCNPDIMAEHYDKNKSGIQELVDYTNQSLVVFEYGGGAIGPQTFGEEIKENFMKKHSVK